MLPPWCHPALVLFPKPFVPVAESGSAATDCRLKLIANGVST
jgi:hypothetical protein